MYDFLTAKHHSRNRPVPDVKLEEIRPVTEGGKKFLRTLREIEQNKVKYKQREVVYHFYYTSKGQYFTTSTTDKVVNKAGNYYYKVAESDIKLLEGKKFNKNIKSGKTDVDTTRKLSSDDDWVFDDAKDNALKSAPSISQPVAARLVKVPEKSAKKEDIENDLLSLFTGVKRAEPEPSTTTEKKPNKIAAVPLASEYMECYPATEEYKEINEEPDFGEKVKEFFNSEEQANEDKKWEQQRRKVFMFGGSAAGNKKGRKKKGDMNRIEKVSFIII